MRCVCVFGYRDAVPALSAVLLVQKVLLPLGRRTPAGGNLSRPQSRQSSHGGKLVLTEKRRMEKETDENPLCLLEVRHLFSIVPSGAVFSLADHQYQIKQSKALLICIL